MDWKGEDVKPEDFYLFIYFRRRIACNLLWRRHYTYSPNQIQKMDLFRNPILCKCSQSGGVFFFVCLFLRKRNCVEFLTRDANTYFWSFSWRNIRTSERRTARTSEKKRTSRQSGWGKKNRQPKADMSAFTSIAHKISFHFLKRFQIKVLRFCKLYPAVGRISQKSSVTSLPIFPFRFKHRSSFTFKPKRILPQRNSGLPPAEVSPSHPGRVQLNDFASVCKVHHCTLFLPPPTTKILLEIEGFSKTMS